MIAFNRYAILALFRVEMGRFARTIVQSLLLPVISTSLYFVVFGAAIGGRMTAVGGVSYGAFIVPGLIMMTLLTESTANGSFGIFLQKYGGIIYEILSAPISAFEILLAFIGAATAKSVIVGLIILLTASFFVPVHIEHPVWMVAFLILTSVTFALFGFILGLWAKGWEQLSLVPYLVMTPLTFLGGAFYSIDMLPPAWRTVTLFNPVVYLVSAFRWSFYGQADVDVVTSLGIIVGFLVLCVALVWWVFRTGWRLKN
jgi:ABC-2 type transport system permease protein